MTELLNLNPKDMKLLQSVPYTHIFKLQIIKDVSMCSHVQSHKLVHVSGIHCHRHACPTSGCVFVSFPVRYCIEHSSALALFQGQDVWK